MKKKTILEIVASVATILAAIIAIVQLLQKTPSVQPKIEKPAAPFRTEPVKTREIEPYKPPAVPSEVPLPKPKEREEKEIMSVEEKGFLFEIQSCKLYAQTITCSLLVTNKGNDREFHLNAECDACFDMNTRIIDDLGNEYRWSYLQIGNKGADKHVKSLLVSGVPMRMVISFGKVSAGFNRLSLLDIGCHSKGAFRVQFRNIPLTLSK